MKREKLGAYEPERADCGNATRLVILLILICMNAFFVKFVRERTAISCAPELRIPENRWMYVVRGLAFEKRGV